MFSSIVYLESRLIMKWEYFTQTLPGNFHSAVRWLNENNSAADVITMEVVGLYVIIVYRLQIE